MVMNKNYYKKLFLIFRLFLSLITGGVSAEQVNDTNHYSAADLKTVNYNSTTTGKLNST